MGAKTLVVSLEKLGNPEKILQKGVRDCADKTFNEVIGYLMDPKEDEDNPAYDADSRTFAQDVGRMMNVGGQERFSLMYLDANSQLSSPVTDLEKRIGEYPDSIARRVSRSESGEEISYDGVKLVADVESTGGRR